MFVGIKIFLQEILVDNPKLLQSADLADLLQSLSQELSLDVLQATQLLLSLYDKLSD